jgi:50S ribosomal protein L16 3-hydroxylase
MERASDNQVSPICAHGGRLGRDHSSSSNDASAPTWCTKCTQTRVPYLESWLEPIGIAEFRRAYLHRGAVALPGTADSARDLLDWNVLQAVLASHSPDVLVVARGELLAAPAPTTSRELGLYLRHGIGLCIRHSERHHPLLERVAKDIAATFPGADVQVQLFVTPADTYGFSWHFDDEDVFIAQTIGKKEYLFRENTVAANETARPDVFTRFSTEKSSICAARLHAGDFLYIPSRWWHMAECIEDSLSISVGVTGA